MTSFRRSAWRWVIAAVVVLLFVVAGFGVYLASVAGALPWQADPTRIAITPFANIPGFSAPAPSPTVIPGSTPPSRGCCVGRFSGRPVKRPACVALILTSP
jgi:hypothetical protein